MIFKQVDSLVNLSGGTGSNSLDTFIDIMTMFDALATEAVNANLNKHKDWKSEPVPIDENEWPFLEGDGYSLNEHQFPYCFNCKCHHKLISQSPGNATASGENRTANEVYLALCCKFSMLKKDLVVHSQFARQPTNL